MAKYKIWIKRDYEFHICRGDFEPVSFCDSWDFLGYDIVGKYLDLFGAFITNKKNEILYIFDSCINDEKLKAVKDNKILHEIADFEIKITDEEWQDKIINKTLSFYEALVFCRDEMKNLR